MIRPLARPLTIVLVSIAVISLGVWLEFRASGGSISLSGNEYRNTSNINRKQYRNALAKWKNLHATEYEAVVQSTNLGKWKIVVHVDKPEDVAPTGHAHRIVDLQ